MTHSIVFHLSPYPATSPLWCNQIISALNSSFFGMYTFSSFNTRFSSTCHSSFLSILTSAFFISSTTLTTSSFLSLVIFILSSIFTSGLSITVELWIYYFLINILLLLSFSIPTFQSGLLLSLFTLSIFFLIYILR